MHLPPVEPVSYSDIYISGDVTIHESAVVAPGTILKAAPMCRIVIGAGVCVGMGSVINASGGAIEVEAGAVLGTGVLMIGCGTIGNNACIGSATTIFDASVEKMAVIPAGSLIGDTSRQVVLVADTPAEEDRESLANNNGASVSHKEVNGSVPTEKPADSIDSTPTEITTSVDSPDVEPQPMESSPSAQSSVVGKVYINQLLFTLFPERDFLKRNKPNSE
jgi:carbon dioxide concentrating mechanism protein CcmN